MQDVFPFVFLLLTIVMFCLNTLALMQLFSLYITLPLLFISIYLTIYSFAYKRIYRGSYVKKRMISK